MISWRLNVFWVWCSLFLAFTGYTQAYPVIPFFLEERYGMTSPELRNFYIGLIAFCGNLGFLLFAPFWGRASDIFGRKKMIIRSNLTATLLIPLMAVMPDPISMSAIRFLIGTFGGISVACMTLVACSTPEQHRGTAMGAVSSAVFSGTLTGNVLGGMIAGAFGISTAFWSGGASLALATLISIFGLREPVPPPRAGEKLTVPKPHIPKFGIFWGLMILMVYMGNVQQLDAPFFPVLVQQVSKEDTATVLFWNGIIGGGAAAAGILGGFLCGWCTDHIPGHRVAIAISIGGGIMLLLQSVCTSLPWLFTERMLMIFFTSGLSPVMQIWLSLTTPQKDRGTFFGYAVSCRAVGWIIAGITGMAVGALADTRSIFVTGGLLMILLAGIIRIVHRKLPFPFCGKESRARSPAPAAPAEKSRFPGISFSFRIPRSLSTDISSHLHSFTRRVKHKLFRFFT